MTANFGFMNTKTDRSHTCGWRDCPARIAGLKDVPGDRILNQVLRKLKARLKAPLADKEWEKVAWLYDRIAARLGVPPAISYPRIRPSE